MMSKERIKERIKEIKSELKILGKESLEIFSQIDWNSKDKTNLLRQEQIFEEGRKLNHELYELRAKEK
tara:strand:- start:66 stop:269 length:204 start_codon:yes stop_codon:yes gene_type:complete